MSLVLDLLALAAVAAAACAAWRHAAQWLGRGIERCHGCSGCGHRNGPPDRR